MSEKNTITIPIVGYMSRLPDGTIFLDRKKSTFCDIGVKAVADFLLAGFQSITGEKAAGPLNKDTDT